MLQVKSSDWLHMESSSTYTSSACNWCALGALGLKKHLFLITQACEMSILWQDLHWYFLAGHLKPSTWPEYPHLEHLSLLVWACLWSNFFLVWWHLLLTFISLVTGWSWLESCFFLCLLGGRSVHWCLIKLIWDAWESLATCLFWCTVAFEAFIFFASCLTLLAWNFSRSCYCH